MSRTYRRKNVWNKHYYVDDWINDPESLAFLQGISNVYGGKLNGKYVGLTKEQIEEKMNAWWTGELSQGWNYGRRNRKEFSRWHLRQLNKMELKNAIKTGNEENLYLTEKKYDSSGPWWYWD